MLKRLTLTFLALFVLAAACKTEPAKPSGSPTRPAGTPSPSPTKREGIFKLDHLIFIVQENRSFDHYFGTYPGASGIPMKGGKPKVCLPHPVLDNKCLPPYHSTDIADVGGPHSQPQSVIDVNHGKMDGFIKAALLQPDNWCVHDPTQKRCKGKVGPQLQPEVVSWHDRGEIPNYWKYADNFVLQDHMFAPTDSWTLPSHLYMVSAWSAICSDHKDPMSCKSDVSGDLEKDRHSNVPYAWTDVTYLLHENGVSWKWFVAPGTCVDKGCKRSNDSTANAMNVIPGFQTVHEDGEIGNVQEYKDYYADASNGTLPSVSWVIPGTGFSEHPSHGTITAGQAFTTNVINAAMQGPDWDSTALFLTWDDWGGFYDHMPPVKVDENGYGIRVPALIISPYAKKGYIDHQTLSFDAYLQLIEDRFLNGQRLDPRTDGRPDPRKVVREDVAKLGDITKAFDFNQEPRKPLVLNPAPGGGVNLPVGVAPPKGDSPFSPVATPSPSGGSPAASPSGGGGG